MPSLTLDTADATELVELLHFLDDWLTVDHERLDTSLQDFVGNRAYDISQLRTDLDRFVFLLGGDHSGHLFDPPQQ
jgi:hypothetical protein